MIRRFDHRSMRFRLILTIGLILLVFQVISVVWLWHESKSRFSSGGSAAAEAQHGQSR